MAKKKTRAKKTVKKTSKVKTTRKPSPAQEGHQLTYVLLGHLKRTRRHYLVIGELLAQVRDGKYYEHLKHPDMADYADKRLCLGKSSLYQYLRVYDWAKASHPEWLGENVKGFMPDFTDVGDLMWIEEKLKSKDLSTTDRKELEALRAAGLSGKLRQADLTEWRGRRRNTDTLTAYYKKLRGFRTRCARISGMPAEVITHLDAAIALLQNHQVVALCGFESFGMEEMLRFV